jgi:hypothetical protein
MNRCCHGGSCSVPCIRSRTERALGHPLLSSICRLYNYVGYTTRLGVLGEGVIIVFWVFGDNVPCVEKTWDESEHAKADINKRVGRADSTFDPDCDGRENDGDETEEEVRGAHIDGWEGFVGKCVNESLRDGGNDSSFAVFVATYSRERP